LVALALIATACSHSGDDANEAPTAPATPDTASADEVPEAHVVKEDAGFTQQGKTINYGVVLENRSSTDAVDVSITVTFLSRNDDVVGSERDTISVIPNGDWYFFGGQVAVTDARVARRMKVALATERAVDASYRLAPVRVRILRGQADPLKVRGRVRNIGEKGLSSSARIGIVLFNREGKVVSGTSTELGRDMTRFGVKPFTASVGAAPDDAAFAEATVDDKAAIG
jgi:hypothetical protein